MTTTQNSQSTSPSRTSAPAAAARPATRYTLDASHSHVGFSVRHMMVSNVRGEFQTVSGEASYDPARPEATTLSATIEVASINTREEKRDAHLRGADFFDAEQHPTITFVSKRAQRSSDGGLDVVGDLTIRGTTREVTLAVEDIAPEHADPWGNLRIGASASTKIRRSDFGMQWNAVLETGGILVGDEIKIRIEAELIKQK